MMTRSFTYWRPASLDEAARALADAIDPVVLGGGTMLVPDMTHGKSRPGAVVDLAVSGLTYIEAGADGCAVGAMTTYTGLLASPQAPRLLRKVASGITGGPQIRNRGTVGGSASYANPASEVPAALVGCGAVLRLSSVSGMREVSARDFTVGAFATVRRPDEVLGEIRFPALPDGAGIGYVKLKLSESSWPIATAAAVALPGEAVRVAVGGVRATPFEIHVPPPPNAGPSLAWRAEIAHTLRAVEVAPWADVLADADYRAEIAPVAVARAVGQAVQELNS